MESSRSPARTDEERERDRAERESRRVVPPPPAAGAPRSRRGHSWVGRGAAALALLVLIAAVGLLVRGLGRKGAPARTASVAAPVVVRVLIPEGETRREIAARARAAGLRGSYLTAAKRSPALDPARFGAPAGTPDLEGFLFPATYELYRGDPASRLVREQLIAFTERFGDAQERSARALGLTPYGLLTVASMIEGEAQLPGDRAKVAAVIYNRLRAGIPLGIDATLRYALDDYTHPLTEAQLALSSPYNTRIHRGLPPTPIGNPGMAAIEAAAHPARVGYLYYVADASGCGDLVFSSSAAQFERDAAAYREALRANGGRVPSCRKR